jgi:hypothetical protein
MPIDELEMLELYVRLFSSPRIARDDDKRNDSYFVAPDQTLIIEQVFLSSFSGDANNIFTSTSESLQEEGMPELALAAEEISKVLAQHSEELVNSIEPQYRVLDYVYPIV